MGQQDSSQYALVLVSGAEGSSVVVKSSRRSENSKEVAFGFQAL